jgi:hypothetical protein
LRSSAGALAPVGPSAAGRINTAEQWG